MGILRRIMQRNCISGIYVLASLRRSTTIHKNVKYSMVKHVVFTHDDEFPGDEGLDLGPDTRQSVPGVHVFLSGKQRFIMVTPGQRFPKT